MKFENNLSPLSDEVHASYRDVCDFVCAFFSESQCNSEFGLKQLYEVKCWLWAFNMRFFTSSLGDVIVLLLCPKWGNYEYKFLGMCWKSALLHLVLFKFQIERAARHNQDKRLLDCPSPQMHLLLFQFWILAVCRDGMLTFFDAPLSFSRCFYTTVSL